MDCDNYKNYPKETCKRNLDKIPKMKKFAWVELAKKPKLSC